jgi:hypothetical protein
MSRQGKKTDLDLSCICRNAIRALLLLTVCIGAAAEERDAGISNEYPNQRIPGKKFSSVRDIDFRNAPILKLTDDDDKEYWAVLKNGAFEQRHSVGGDEIELQSVRYLKVNSGTDLALVRLYWLAVGGSSSPQGVVMVIGLDGDGVPIVRQKIEYNVRGVDEDEAWARFDPANNQLRVSAVHGWEHCCNKERIIVTFQWNGEKFIPVGRKLMPLHHPDPKP